MILVKVACGDRRGNIRVYDLGKMELAHEQAREYPGAVFDNRVFSPMKIWYAMERRRCV